MDSESNHLEDDVANLSVRAVASCGRLNSLLLLPIMNNVSTL